MMSNEIWIGTLVPFLGTILGSAMVFFSKKEIPVRIEKSLLGFAAGIMVSASFFSLLLPALEQAGYIQCALAFLAGILFLLFLDEVIPHVHAITDQEEGIKTPWKKTTKLFFAMTLHNIPEGMAVGVVFAAFLQGQATITFAAALSLAIGIAIQNFPEGAVLSVPMHTQGMSKWKAFLYGSLSGIVEPIGTLLTIAFSQYLTPILPYFLSFAAGAMMYVVVEELIPEAQEGKHSNFGTLCFGIGFAVMMVLDGVLG